MNSLMAHSKTVFCRHLNSSGTKTCIPIRSVRPTSTDCKV